jgi:CheY-like chemotaxis protein
MEKTSLTTNLNSPRRLQALAETCLINSPPEDSFDRYTRLCSALLEVPVSLAVLVESDRLFFKSRYTRVPLPALGQSGPATQSFCQNVIINCGAFVVEDCRKDERTKDSIAVTQYHIRAYAGLPIRTPEDEIIGSFCALDFQPRAWTERDLEHLADLRNGIESEIALRLQVFRLDKTGADLRRHLRAAQQLFANLGHEVRTPLNAMVNLSAACAEQGLPPPADELAQTVLTNAQKLSQLLEGILDLAALEAGQVISEASPTEIEPLLRTNQAMISSLGRPELSLDVMIDPEMPRWLSTDGRRLSQLLAILLQYHLGRARWKGRLYLEASWPEAELLDLRLSCDAYSMEPDELASLFTFNPSGVEASGLSPAIICSLVDLLSARLWASAGNNHVHFHLRVPVGAAVPPAPPPESVDRPLKLLAIDDDTTNLCVLDFLARKLGHVLSTATSGIEGLELLSEEKFDVLLLDLRMPVMDGFEVARQIRQRGLKLPIVAVTADASEAAKQKARSSGMDAFMTKPIKRAELANVLAGLPIARNGQPTPS